MKPEPKAKHVTPQWRTTDARLDPVSKKWTATGVVPHRNGGYQSATVHGHATAQEAERAAIEQASKDASK